ncbi:MAG TPA: hypothetical protein VL197_13640 [Nitrospirota bacterium]|nr:hypothetical protein [Nitrospirota bacterium]
MNLEEIIIELYRISETKKWEGQKSDEALAAAIEGMERIWETRQADLRKNAAARQNRKQPRNWC